MYDFQGLFAVFFDERFEKILQIVLAFSPVWLPIALAFVFWSVWIQYVRASFGEKAKRVLLEIYLPPEVFKSPLAMELVLSGLHQTGGEGSWFRKYIAGSSRPWYTFEIVSDEGRVHFYMNVPEAYKNLAESQFYSQYPNIEITEVPDYTDKLPYYNKDLYRLWGGYFTLTKPDPYPIKTYVDYGLDKDPKEEFKIDPLTSLIEHFGSLGKGEQLWLQIFWRSHREKKTGWFGKKTSWQDEGRELIDKINKSLVTKVGDKTEARFPTKAESNVMEAIDRNISKLGFDVGIRSMYFASDSDYKGFRVPSLIGLFKNFSTPLTGEGGLGKKDFQVFGYNGFKPTKTTDFDEPWQDFLQMREMKNRTLIVDGYRRRSFFTGPYVMTPFVLNSEELATIFHPIGTTLQAPTVERISSRKGTAPGNLPR